MLPLLRACVCAFLLARSQLAVSPSRPDAAMRVRLTLMGEVGCEPMALTMASLPPAPGSASIMRWLAARTRSAVAMHVPPNLWICQCGPRLNSSVVMLGAVEAVEEEAARQVVVEEMGDGARGEEAAAEGTSSWHAGCCCRVSLHVLRCCWGAGTCTTGLQPCFSDGCGWGSNLAPLNIMGRRGYLLLETTS